MKGDNPIIFLVLIAMIAAIAACNKNDTLTSTQSALTTATATSAASAIAVALTSTGDTVYAINACTKNQLKDSIDFATLPASSLSYLDSTYPGFTATKAYAILDSTGTFTGYVAVIEYSGNPVAVKFTAAGAFVKVLEQRKGHNMENGSWLYDNFGDRNSKAADTIALAALPTAVINYFAANNSVDTLLKAFRTRDSSIVVLSTSGGLFYTIFSSTGTFVARAEVVRHHRLAMNNAIDLPPACQLYFTTTYIGYGYKERFRSLTTPQVQHLLLE